jgi:hypothetical protein
MFLLLALLATLANANKMSLSSIQCSDTSSHMFTMFLMEFVSIVVGASIGSFAKYSETFNTILEFQASRYRTLSYFPYIHSYHRTFLSQINVFVDIKCARMFFIPPLYTLQVVSMEIRKCTALFWRQNIWTNSCTGCIFFRIGGF